MGNSLITYSKLALSLASDYDSVFVINPTDDSYNEYIAVADGDELKLRWSGDNFYSDIETECKKQVYPEDQEYFLNMLKKETIQEFLKNSKSFAVRYRLYVNDEPIFYHLKIIRGYDENIIIGVKNVDEQVKREMQVLAKSKTYSEIAVANDTSSNTMELSVKDALGSAMEMAGKDSLTGAENKKLIKSEQCVSQVQEDVTNADYKDIEFYKLFEELVSAMTDTNKVDKTKIESLLIDISKLLRLAKGITHVFKNPIEEKNETGEILCAYDSKKECVPVITHKIVSSVQSGATMTVYMSPDEPPLTDIERRRVELVMRATIKYIARNRLGDKVEEMTYYDENGYKNLRSFYLYISKISEDKNYDNKTIIRYNLRHFSLINHELGRKVGDIIMRRHYDTLSEMVGDQGIVARLGGDNFILFCSNEKLGNVLSYLSEASVMYDNTDGKCVNLSTSAGVFRIPDNYVVKAPKDVMENVVFAFSIAQNGGNEHIVFYNEALINNREKSMQVQQLFPQALRDEEFHVFYQPKVNIETGELVGAEALCRWFHDGAIVPPMDFIPMLEETNEICKLDFYMLDRVCADIARWMNEGKKAVRISVNLSRKHMVNANLLQSILKIIDRHNVPHSCIEIELTETTTDVEFSDLKRVVNGLQRVGIYTSVDDFGIGYSSLNLIREVPWNVIKVDRSFLPIDDDNDDKTRTIMFKYIVAMARDLGIECIVEGVETEKQLEVLRDNKCDFAQGFFFDKPLPVRDFENRMMTHCYKV